MGPSLHGTTYHVSVVLLLHNNPICYAAATGLILMLRFGVTLYHRPSTCSSGFGAGHYLVSRELAGELAERQSPPVGPPPSSNLGMCSPYQQHMNFLLQLCTHVRVFGMVFISTKGAGWYVMCVRQAMLNELHSFIAALTTLISCSRVAFMGSTWRMVSVNDACQ